MRVRVYYWYSNNKHGGTAMPEITLPSGTAARYRGMTGREEDILTNERKQRSGDHVDEIMANCVQSLGFYDEGEFVAEDGMVEVDEDDILALQTPDRMALLLAIRRASYGDDMDIEARCRRCEEPFSVHIDLSKIEEKPIPDDYLPGRGFEAEIEGDDDEDAIPVVFDYMTGHGERMVSKQKTGTMTAAMRARLKKVEGVHANGLKKWLLDLPIRKRNQLRNLMAEKDAGPDMTRTFDCPYCGTEHTVGVHHAAGFFFPGE